MTKVYFDLSCSTLLCDPINFEALCFCEVINIVDNWSIFVNCRH